MYGAALSAVALIMLGAFLMRSTLDVTVLRDRAPLFVRLSDGGIRNAYTIKIVNKTHDEAPLMLMLEAPAGLRLTVQDVETAAEGRYSLSRRADGITQYRVFVTAPAWLKLQESTPITFRLLDTAGRPATSQTSVFLGPKP
jgi:polyferredoxin